MLTLTVHNLGDMVILRCTGRIVRGEETAILCAAAQQQGRNVILDLSGVDAIDAAGIGLLVSLQAAGIYLKLMNPTKQVREILRVTNLESVFEISESQSLDDYPVEGILKPDQNSKSIENCNCLGILALLGVANIERGERSGP